VNVSKIKRVAFLPTGCLKGKVTLFYDLDVFIIVID